MNPRLLVVIAIAFLAGCQWLSLDPGVSRATPAAYTVTAQSLTLRDFRLQSGAVLPEVTLAYETHGKLNAAGTNAILVAHGNTATFHVAGVYADGPVKTGIEAGTKGWWDAMIGPGKPFDTDRYFVVSSNMLGGSWGSTGPRSVDPRTRKPYGPDFPAITLVDMVTAQRAMLERLGVRHLVVVAGGSYGGFITFQWGVTFPGMTDGLVIAASSPTGGKNPASIQRIVDRLAKDPDWNGGRYYDRAGAMVATMTALRVDTLRSYGRAAALAPTIPDPVARAAAIEREARPWAEAFDPNSLIVQRKAMEYRDHEREFAAIKAKVLYVLSSTDKLFPTSLAPKVMGSLKAAGVDATYFELVSENGHSGYTRDADKWAPALREFLARLPEPR